MNKKHVHELISHKISTSDKQFIKSHALSSCPDNVWIVSIIKNATLLVHLVASKN